MGNQFEIGVAMEILTSQTRGYPGPGDRHKHTDTILNLKTLITLAVARSIPASLSPNVATFQREQTRHISLDQPGDFPVEITMCLHQCESVCHLHIFMAETNVCYIRGLSGINLECVN